MLRLPPFRYLRAGSAAEAARALADNGGRAMLLAGGTDLLPNLKRRQFDADVLVAIGHLDELRAAVLAGEAVYGAGMRLCDVAVMARSAGHRALAQAVGQIANPQIQRQGTIGGNLCVDTRCNYYNQTEEWRAAIGYCMKRDGDICLVAPGSAKCWAVSSSDAAPALMALGARVVLQGPQGERDIPLRALYRDDGIDYLTRRPDELLSRILVPHGAGWRSTYRKVRRRGSFDFPLLGVAAAVQMAGAEVRDARLALGGLHTHPIEVLDAAERLIGTRLGEEAIGAAAEAAFRAARPLDNADLAYHWRKKMVRVEVRRALRELAGAGG